MRKIDDENNLSTRRAAIVSGVSAMLAVGSVSSSPDAFAANKDEEKKKKVVAVPYTPYVPQSESSEEMLEVAKQLKEAGSAIVRRVLVRELQQTKRKVR